MLPGDVISSSRSLFVTFESDTSVTASGFEINYSAQEEGESCGNTPTHVGGEKGQIWITWAQYRNNMNCQWQISVDSTKRVHLTFEQFDVEDSNDCANDSVVVTDSHAGDVTYTMCGNNLPGDVTSSDNNLLVVFKTDGSETRRGFLITYTARTIIPVSDVCGHPKIAPKIPERSRGSEVMDHSWPWHVSIILLRYGHVCSGSVLDHQWIVTAAHCVYVWCSRHPMLHSMYTRNNGEYGCCGSVLLVTVRE
ncbi:hypothetical protein NP493_195g01015 [Ridgeia piscesae]|uniref:CUB domain-containing protein n=1 Tax=Ridgeia piscesae TaxID=27915 RepID=A0AAD9P1S9_RIDPI|nr:hypothetical protein NP493_195g01015 [Ridgeia piscesae]